LQRDIALLQSAQGDQATGLRDELQDAATKLGELQLHSQKLFDRLELLATTTADMIQRNQSKSAMTDTQLLEKIDTLAVELNKVSSALGQLHDSLSDLKRERNPPDASTNE
jgi:chromosome segregation ATPase